MLRIFCTLKVALDCTNQRQYSAGTNLARTMVFLMSLEVTLSDIAIDSRFELDVRCTSYCFIEFVELRLVLNLTDALSLFYMQYRFSTQIYETSRTTCACLENKVFLGAEAEIGVRNDWRMRVQK
jgi:hypothetical protein